MTTTTIDDPEPMYPIRVSKSAGLRAKRFTLILPWVLIYFLFAFMFGMSPEGLLILFTIVIFVALWQLRVIDFVMVKNVSYERYQEDADEPKKAPPQKAPLSEEELAILIANAIAKQHKSEPPHKEESKKPPRNVYEE